MKKELKWGASTSIAANTAPARSWSQRDFPLPANQRKIVKAEARTSMHFKILSRTGK
jgi:propanediol dehydratase small subunit